MSRVIAWNKLPTFLSEEDGPFRRPSVFIEIPVNTFKRLRLYVCF